MSTEGDMETSSDLQQQLSGGQKFMKWIIVGLSGLYLIFGIVLAAVGSYAMSGDVAKVTGVTLPQGIIAVGVFLIITALLGVLSAWKESRLGLGVFFVLMAIWSIILISVGIAVTAEKSNAQNLVNSNWQSIPDDLKTSIQAAAGCCGRNYYNESVYFNNAFSYFSGAGPQFNILEPGCDTPSDACDQANTAKGVSCPDPRKFGITQDPDGSWVASASSGGGCTPELISAFQSNFQTAGACGIAFAVIMFVGLAFTCWLMRGIKDRGMNMAIEKNRLKTQKDLERKRARGKGGLKIPDNVL